MKIFKILFALGISCFFYLNAFSQTKSTKEEIALDVSIFQHYFEIFPLNNQTTVDDLNTKYKSFKESSKDSIGFGGVLHLSKLRGGTIMINSSFVSYKNRIVMVQTTFDKSEFKSLDIVLKSDSAIKSKFDKLFTLIPGRPGITDSVYQYTFTNQPLFEEYKEHISEYLGKQSEVDTNNCEFEYGVLNQPTDSYEVARSYSINYLPNYAINKLKEKNRIDCILNIIRGCSLPGRIYGIRGLLELVKEGGYILKKEDKELIRKVLGLNLKITVYYDRVGYFFPASLCFDKVLLEVLEDNFKYNDSIYDYQDSIYDKSKQLKYEKTSYEHQLSPGSGDQMREYIKKNLRYPESAIKQKVEGTVYVQVKVSKTGIKSDVKILRGIGSGCDEEAVRIYTEMPDEIFSRAYEGTGYLSTWEISVKFVLPIRAIENQNFINHVH